MITWIIAPNTSGGMEWGCDYFGHAAAYWNSWRPDEIPNDKAWTIRFIPIVDIMEIGFKRPQDAVLFKLMWGGS